MYKFRPWNINYVSDIEKCVDKYYIKSFYLDFFLMHSATLWWYRQFWVLSVWLSFFLVCTWVKVVIHLFSFQGKEFIVEDAALGFSVLLYSIAAIAAIALLMLRRKLAIFGNAELGGTVTPKYVSGAILVTLWFGYVLLSSLQAYGKITAPF